MYYYYCFCLVAKSCPTLCNPMDCACQARILEWVSISFSGDLPNPEVESASPALQVNSLPLSH